MVNLAIVYLKRQADEIGKNGRGASLSSNRRRPLARLGSYNWKTGNPASAKNAKYATVQEQAYGTIWGPVVEC